MEPSRGAHVSRLGEAALAIVEGHKRPIEPTDLALIETMGNLKVDRRTKFGTPELWQAMPAVAPTDTVQLFAMESTAQDWRTAALAEWHAAGGYWTLLPRWAWQGLHDAGLAPPVSAAADDLDTTVTHPLTPVRDLSRARAGERTAEAVLMPDAADTEHALTVEAEQVRQQLELLGVTVTTDPRQFKLPQLPLFGGSSPPRA